MDLSQTLIMFGNVVLATVLGMSIGFEREHRHKAAGLRTYSLVAAGSALFTILSFHGYDAVGKIVGYDPSRIASQIVVGVGFLGAGLIFMKENQVRGLTGAAGIWVTAAIGMAVGMGLRYLAVFSTALVIIVLYLLDLFKEKVFEESNKEPVKK
jgi:putative Mg2+ transporter-C (MgtC) family protein